MVACMAAPHKRECIRMCAHTCTHAHAHARTSMRARRMVLYDWQRGKIPYFSLPPGYTPQEEEDVAARAAGAVDEVSVCGGAGGLGGARLHLLLLWMRVQRARWTRSVGGGEGLGVRSLARAAGGCRSIPSLQVVAPCVMQH